MKIAFKHCATALLGCFLALGAGLASSAPKVVNATYNGLMNGMAIGVITEHYESDGSTYRIVSDTKPMGLATFFQRQPLRFLSNGHVGRDGLRPSRFEARRSANDAPQVAADLDWSQNQLVLRHHGKTESFPLNAGTQDRLSVMYQFMFLSAERLRSLEFTMTNGRKVDRYRYRPMTDVELETALGRIKTMHLVKQRDPGDTVTEVWLSPQHHYLPVKMLIVGKDGMRFEQLIQSLELRE
jgi:hypothetical protein